MYNWVSHIKIEIKRYLNFFSSKVFAEELPGSVHIINSLVPDSHGICKTDVIVNSNAKKINQTDHLCLAISDKK